MGFQFGAVFAAFLAAGSAPNPDMSVPAAPAVEPQSIPLIEPAALKAMIASPVRYMLVDVRQPDEFAAGHIAGATLMPLATLEASYRTLPKDMQLVVYCRSGHRSAQAVTFLLGHGYSRAISLNGGYLAWSAQAK